MLVLLSLPQATATIESATAAAGKTSRCTDPCSHVLPFGSVESEQITFGDSLVPTDSPCLGEPVEDHRQQHDTHPGRHAITHLEVRFGEAADSLDAQRAAADQSGDDHRGQHHQDDLVDAQHDRLERQRQLHLEELLSRCRAERDRRLARREGHFLQTEADKTNPRRQGIDHCGDQTRRAPDVEEEDDGHEIDELRQNLRSVEEGPQCSLEPTRPTGPHSDRNSEADADRDRHQHLTQRVHCQSQLLIAAMPMNARAHSKARRQPLLR